DRARGTAPTAAGEPQPREEAPGASRPRSGPSAAALPKKSGVTEEALMDEIRDMKQWIMRMSKQQQLAARPEALQSLYNRLTTQEVGERWAERLLEAVEAELAAADASDSGYNGDPGRDAVWKIAERTLLAWLRGFEDGRIASDTRVVHFVGPTGVGKTTSIAKLAAEQTLKAGRKVGFITSDTYRIAAVDQLRTYATILNVPLEVVFSPAEVTRAFQALEDCELIFMDTAGRNFRNELYVSEVNSLLQPGGRSETFLVLSLTGKTSDMSAVAANFAKFGVTRVLFTKQDETNAVGAVLNLALEHGMRPAYVAYGQTVPDDIAPFRASDYVKLLLGAPHD
ncbi:flagellar biosynthesis protein FlhF, partial [Paenibacillus sp. GCM10023250]|uniref:flagellar biosynthesis protein FlhF n=1 Tax=Paenibacillus sp. GCM10023250 TaxID=3252648 RepID=UPI003613A0F8